MSAIRSILAFKSKGGEFALVVRKIISNCKEREATEKHRLSCVCHSTA